MICLGVLNCPASPCVLKEDSKYSLGFKMTASSSIDLHYAKAEDAIIALKVGADPFSVTFTIN